MHLLFSTLDMSADSVYDPILEDNTTDMSGDSGYDTGEARRQKWIQNMPESDLLSRCTGEHNYFACMFLYVRTCIYITSGR